MRSEKPKTGPPALEKTFSKQRRGKKKEWSLGFGLEVRRKWRGRETKDRGKRQNRGQANDDLRKKIRSGE